MNKEDSVADKMQSVILLLDKIAYTMCKDYCNFFDKNLTSEECEERINEHCSDCPMQYIS